MKDAKTMMRMYSQMKYILNSQQKRKAIGVFLAVLIGAFLETIGVSSLLPFVQILTCPAELMKKEYIIFAMQLFSITDIKIITLMIGIAVILVYLLKNIGLAISSFLLVKFKAELTKELRYQMMLCYMNRPYLYFVNNDTGSIIRGVSGDVDSVISIIDYVFHILTEGSVIILVGIYVVYIDPFMALGVIIVGLICFAGIVFALKKRMSKLGIISRVAEGQAYSITTQIVHGIKDIMVRQKREMFLKKFDDANEKNRKAQIGSQFASILPERFIEAICISGIIGVALLRIVLGDNNEVFMSTLAIFAVAAFRILPAISRITGYVNLLIYGRPRLEGAYDNIKSAREYMKTLNNYSENDSELLNNLQFERSLKVNNISWKYDEAKGDVLRNLSIEIRKGETIGIIGESGSGKSTLSDILLGLYKPQLGSVTVDEYSIFDIPYAWSKMMGYVPQTVYLLDDTIRNNVAFGEDDINDDDVWKALEKASLKKYVENLPDGIDTLVGEGGIKFSGGQRQRIAIARALFAKPSILILDEATSALDNETENAVMEAIESLQGTITMIIIAHRLSTIRNCDRIFEISEGKAIEVKKDRFM